MKQITALFWFCRKCCNRPLLPIKGAKKLPNLKSHIYQDPRKIQVDKMTVSSVPHSSLLQQVWTIFYIGGKKPNLKAAIWLNSVFLSPLFCRPVWISMTVVLVWHSAPRPLCTTPPPSSWSTTTMPSTPTGLSVSRSAHVSAALPALLAAFFCRDGELELHFRSVKDSGRMRAECREQSLQSLHMCLQPVIIITQSGDN